MAETLERMPGIRKRLVAAIEGFEGDYFELAEVPAGLQSREEFEEHLNEIFGQKKRGVAGDGGSLLRAVGARGTVQPSALEPPPLPEVAGSCTEGGHAV